MSALPPPTDVPDSEKDASLKEILLYAGGNVQAALAGQFFNLLNVLLVVALGLNPIFLGLIIGIKTFWDGVIDPVMAQITDHSRTRWGRRRPYILVGGVSQVMLLVTIFLFFPRDGSIKSNAELATEKAMAAEVSSAPKDFRSDSTSPAEGRPAQSVGSEKAAPSAVKKTKPGIFQQVREGIIAFFSGDNRYHQKVTVYLLVAGLIFTTLTAIHSVPYYALGIELCPSYDGRTRLVTYSSLVSKVVNFIQPWILPFCLLPIFANVVDGLLWYSIFVAVVGIPTTILMVWSVKERYAAVLVKKRGPGLWKSIWLTASNVHFLKILFLYKFIGVSNGIFTQVGTFLTIYWIFKGDALAGGVLAGYAGTLATVISFGALPVLNWACRKLQKHRALRYAIIWMSLGCALKWVLLDPKHPYWQLWLPLFFSVGISSIYFILPTMMADVTDIDELRTGVRREGMFGAVMAFLSKVIGAIQPVLAGVVLVMSGFDANLGADQTPETIFRMRLMFSLIPAGLLLLALFALWRYPLTREYMEEVKATLIQRRAQAAREANESSSEAVSGMAGQSSAATG